MGGKSSTITSAEERILSLQVQRSSQGLTLPVIYGRTRVAGNLVWYGDFVTIEHKTTTRQGGKGGGGVKQVDISYTYEAAVMLALCEGEIQGVGRIWRDKEKFDSLAQLRLTLMRGGDEQPLWTHLQQAKHQDQALNYSGTAYLCSPNYELTKSAQIYQHNFEVIGKLGYSGNIPDANPREIVLDLLTNQRYGCGFPSQNIGDTDRYSNYCRAVGIFLSPAYTEQGEAQRNISELLEQTNSAAVFSQGRLKIIPYGDGNYSGNGAVYVADNKAVYDLTDDDFIVSGAQDPVKVERKTNADAFNQIQVEYLDRDNDYNVAIAEVKDQANIEQYGLRPKDAVKMHGICDAKVAQKVAQQLLQRALYVRNEYEFKLGWKYCLLEPMDIVTLTDAGLGLNKTPVRITEIEEDEEGVLSIKAEDYPVGVYTVSEYPTQPSLGYSADYNVSPGNAHVPVIFEAPLQLTGGEPQIWLATAGGDMWGGAEVWVSTDGDSYTRVGAVNHKARFGSLTAALPNGAVFDRTNTLGVEISAGQLTGGTEQDSRDLLTLCYVDGEFLAYANAELKGVGRYTLGNLTRGAYGSTINAHAAGSQFARIDEALFKYAVPRNWIGRTVWVKLVSYNVFSGGIQDLAEVPAYSYTIKGAPLGQIQNLRLTSSWAYGKEAVIAWDKLDGADTYDVEIYAGNSQRRLRSVSGIVDNSYTYTQADMKSDGGQVRDIVFKVRGRAVTGKTGNWAQIAAQNPQIQALQGIAIDSGLKQAFFTCQKPAEEDFAGIIVWVSENAAVPTTDANKVYDGAETFVTVAKCNGKPLEKGKTYHLRAAGYDSFGKDNLRVSSSVSFTVYDVSTNDLSESNLNQALRDKLALIDGNGAGSVNARIAAEAQARAAVARTAEAAKAAAKKAGELGNKITAVERVNNEQAQQIRTVTAAQGTTAAGLEVEKKARADGDRAEAAARETLAGRVSTAEGNITRETQARVTAINAQTAATEALKTRVGNTESSITALRETVNQKDSARSSEIQTLTAKIDGVSVGGRNYALSTGTPGKVLTVSGNNQTKNVTIDVSSALELKQGDSLIISCDIELANATSPYGKPYPRIGAEFSVIYADNSVGYFAAWYDEAVSGTSKTLKQRLVAKRTVAKEVKALRSFIVQARYQTSESIKVSNVKLERGTVATDWTPAPEDNDGLQEVRGTVQVVQNTLVKAIGDIKSLGERITTAQSTADGNKATVQAHARSINGLEAQYTVKVDANGKVAGFGLATAPKNGTPESKFIVNVDRFGIGAPGKADVFPFTVDTRQNRVGVNGELVVNGKAIVDRLNAGDIHGDKITANTLDANRLKAGSVTAREIGANAVTADKIQVADLSAVSSNLGSITGGSLNIGGGNFTVSPDGILTANNAVIRGRIEADSGYFNGTVRASSVEGDVMKAHRLRWTEGNVWVLNLDKDPLPRVLIPNFRVISETYGNRVVQARLMLNGGLLNPLVTKDYELFRAYYYDNAKHSSKPSRRGRNRDSNYIELTDYRYKTRLEYPIQIIPAGKPISLKLTLASHESVFSPFVSVSYLSQSDYEYKQLLGRMVWRTFAEDFRYDNRRQVYLGGDRRVHNYQNQMRNHWEPYGGLLQLPDNIYGISFEYRLYTNRDWSTMITFDRSDAYEVVKKYRANGFGPYSLYKREFDTAIPKSNLLFFVEKSWQYIELRNIRVLIPESRENEVWQVG
ncbi:TPA: phage tail protein [Neisseria meningitidis]|uniref:phage tail protein n=1 Tax=Neisseria meningitidis TaxID=487 RepID=UPI0007665885|nr:phage tail protein [Neisseria meningitidis]CWP38154.1 phage associated protein [Neisseria meningitidis]CWT22957.1 phage associated protein [Neisseria meningitidis]